MKLLAVIVLSTLPIAGATFTSASSGEAPADFASAQSATTRQARDSRTTQPSFKDSRSVSFSSIRSDARNALEREFKARDVPTSKLSCGTGEGSGAIKWAVGCSHGGWLCWANVAEDGVESVNCARCGPESQNGASCTPWNR